MSATLPVPDLSPAFDVVVELGPIADHGLTRAGHRRVIPILGGRLSDATGAIDLEARIETGGADWQLVRSDGALEIDGRYTAITEAGEQLYLHAKGLRTGPPSVLAALARGEDVDPSAYYFRTVVTVETSAARLQYLQHALFVAACIREAATVRYRAWRVG